MIKHIAKDKIHHVKEHFEKKAHKIEDKINHVYEKIQNTIAGPAPTPKMP